MSRWQPDARERLELAAIELFTEHGFAETTVPQITARAGLTTRTFFRHFADKREVLFVREAQLPGLAARMIAEAPASLTPMEIVSGGLEQVAAAQFAGGVDNFIARKAIIRSDAGLREREMLVMASLTEALRSGFVARGVSELDAELAAHITVTTFGISIGRWLTSGGRSDLPTLLHETLAAFRAVMSDPGWTP